MSTGTQNHSIDEDGPAGTRAEGGSPGRSCRGRLVPAQDQLVDEALQRARAGQDIGELPEEVRDHLSDAMLDERAPRRPGG